METKRFCFFCDNLFLGLGFSTLTATLLSLLTQTHRHPRTHTSTLTHARNGTGPIKARGPPKHAFGPSKGSSHGTVTARSRHGHGTRVTALSRHCHGTLSRHGHGTVTARYHGTVTALSRHITFRKWLGGTSKHPKGVCHHWPRGRSGHPECTWCV